MPILFEWKQMLKLLVTLGARVPLTHGFSVYNILIEINHVNLEGQLSALINEVHMLSI